MSNQSYIEVNVSINGRHYFATAPRSIDFSDVAKARQIANDLREFYTAKGIGKVEVTITLESCVGSAIPL